MSLWFELRVNEDMIGRMVIRRRQYLDLSDKAAIADVVSDYEVWVDGREIGNVSHRYGDGAWVLAGLALALVQSTTQQSSPK